MTHSARSALVAQSGSVPEINPGRRPGEVPPRPDEGPQPGPAGPRTPYPVNDPGIADPAGPGADPDVPGMPGPSLPQM
ncbi:MAG TPA: hypothetical protein VEA41_12990 [Salinarimonas sp.]|nr:hypothetical protein [Salinarimonas sp.]